MFLILCLVSVSAYAHGVDDETQLFLSANKGVAFGPFLYIGAKHMITGYDHLLFIFGVIFFLTKFTEVVKFITAFTIGHSITLIFATLSGITANYFLVDAVIALTVVYKGFDNLDGFRKYFKINPPNLLVLVFIYYNDLFNWSIFL